MRAGFALNLAKCLFCQGEITFLSHGINKIGERSDPGRMEGILKHAAPKYAKQLRLFLGTCNLKIRYVVGEGNDDPHFLDLSTRWR
jgi:hypothetical protein